MSKKVIKTIPGKGESRQETKEAAAKKTPAKKTAAKKTQSKGQIGPAVRTEIANRISVGDSSSSEDPDWNDVDKTNKMFSNSNKPKIFR